MKIVDLCNPKSDFTLTDCGLCLGNFDGVHRGHRALIDRLKKERSALGLQIPLGAFLFSAPPCISPAGPAPQLTTLAEKLELLGAAGLDFAILYDFEELRDMAPDDFVTQILIEQCHCRLAVCGFNYTYGAKGAGNVTRLQETFGAEHALFVVEPVLDNDRPISSSVIRGLLENGQAEAAATLLGRPFFITGTVLSGRHVGGKMGFPTANLAFPPKGLVPALGVYASIVHIGDQTYLGVTNVGVRPTFDDGEIANCETFILNYSGDLYGHKIRVSLLHFLRPEKKFDSMAALEAQINRDIARAKDYFANGQCL